MKAATALLLVSSLPLFGNSARAGQTPDADEEVLHRAGVKTDNASLLAFLRRQAEAATEAGKVPELIRDFDSDQIEVREAARRKVIEIGVPAIAALRQAKSSAEPEVARRARDCLARIYWNLRIARHLFAARLLARRRVEGSVEALLGYLPYAQEQETEEEIWYGLEALALKDGKVHPGLLAALSDEKPQRRAVAACLVGRLGSTEQRGLVRARLKDSDAWVRLRAAQGLLAGKDAAGIPVLVALLGEKTPVVLAWQAEELLHWVAGDAAPEAVIGAGKEAERGRCREAWERWWRDNKDRVDLTKEASEQRRPGLILLFTNEGRELYGCDGRVRCRLAGHGIPNLLLQNDPQLKRGEHALGKHDLEGTITGQSQTSADRMIASRRLPGGNTLAIIEDAIEGRDRQKLVVIGPKKEIVWEKIYPPEETPLGPYGSRILPSGRMCFAVEKMSGAPFPGQIVDVDLDTGAERRLPCDRPGPKIPKERSYSLTYSVLPSGNWLITYEPLWQLEFREGQYIDQRIPGILEEMDRSGKPVWRCTAAPKVSYGIGLRNGNILVLDECVVELDRKGRRLWELVRYGNFDTCLSLVRFGLDQPRSPDWNVETVAYRTRRLRSKDEKVVDRALEKLKGYGHEALPAVPDLIELLEHRPEKVYYSIMETVGSIGPRAFPALLRALDDKRPRVRAGAIACIAWLHWGKGGPSPAEQKVIDNRFIQALRDPNVQVRHNAAYALVVCRTEAADVVPALVAALKDKDAAVVDWAVTALGKKGPEAADAVPALIEMCKGSKHELRWTIFRALGQIGPGQRDSMPFLLSALRDKEFRSEWRVIAEALETFGPKGKAAVPLLIETFKDKEYRKDLKVWWSIASALGRIDPVVAVPLLLEALKSKDYETRLIVVTVFKEMGPDSAPAVPALIHMLKEEGKSRRVTLPGSYDRPRLPMEAAEALGRIGARAKEAVPALIEAIPADPSKCPFPERTDERIAWIWIKNRTRVAAIVALGQIGPDARAAIPTLEEALRSPDWDGHLPSDDEKFKINRALKRIRGQK